MVRTVFVGCGAALEHLYRKPLCEMERRGWLEVVAVADPSPERSRRAAEWFRHAGSFPSLEGSLEAASAPDLVIIASPPAFHAVQACAAFAAGCHVLCEKPMSESVEGAQQMVSAAAGAGRLLAVGMARRFYPSVAAARAWVRGNNGFPMKFSYREGSLFDWPVASAAQFRRSTGGGGVLIDKGIHALDTLCHIFGPGRLVRSADDAPRGHGVESNMVLDLSFGATRGLMQVSWEAPLNNGFQVAGQEEELWMPISPIDAVWIRRLSAGAVLPWSRREAIPTWPSDLSSGRFSPKNIFDCIRLELVSMLRAIHMGEPLVADGAEGLSVMRLLVEAYERAAPLRQPWLPEAERRSVAARHWRSNGHAASPSSPASEAAPSLTTFASRAH